MVFGLDGHGEQFLRDLEVLVERDRGTVHMWDWKVGSLPSATWPASISRRGRTQESSVLLGAVVGVQGDGDAVVLGNLVGVGGEGQRAGDAVLDGGAGAVFGTADGHLDDAVGLGLGEALEGGGDGLGRGHVNRGVGELAIPCAIQHLCIDLRGAIGTWSLLIE